jgi:uncharacterized protein YggE
MAFARAAVAESMPVATGDAEITATVTVSWDFAD